MKQIIQQFKDFLYQVGYSKNIQKTLPVLVHEFLEQQHITDIHTITQQKVKMFYNYLQIRSSKRRGGALSEGTINYYVYGLQIFFSWAETTEQIHYNPISAIKFKKPEKNQRQPLTQQEVQQLFTAANTLKQIAVLHLFYSCGLRRTEAQLLNISDIHFKQRLLYVRKGKGAKRRVIPLTIKVAKDLEQYYLQERCNSKSKIAKDEDAFILSQWSNRMSGNKYNQLLKRIINQTNNPNLIAQNYSLHHLRHSIATHLLQSGMHMIYVKDFLGHSSLEATLIYAKPTTEQLKLL